MLSYRPRKKEKTTMVVTKQLTKNESKIHIFFFKFLQQALMLRFRPIKKEKKLHPAMSEGQTGSQGYSLKKNFIG